MVVASLSGPVVCLGFSLTQAQDVAARSLEGLTSIASGWLPVGALLRQVAALRPQLNAPAAQAGT